MKIKSNKVSRAESCLLEVFKELPKFCIQADHPTQAVYILALRAATEYNEQQGCWVKLPAYNQIMAEYLD